MNFYAQLLVPRQISSVFQSAPQYHGRFAARAFCLGLRNSCLRQSSKSPKTTTRVCVKVLSTEYIVVVDYGGGAQAGGTSDDNHVPVHVSAILNVATFLIVPKDNYKGRLVRSGRTCLVTGRIKKVTRAIRYGPYILSGKLVDGSEIGSYTYIQIRKKKLTPGRKVGRKKKL